MAFEKVTRQRAKLRMALTGVSGAGKTLGALYIAYGITGDWSRIALIDTEHERARFYASRSDLDTGEFLYAPFSPPYSPDRYKALVAEGAAAVGSDGVVIVDSFSHAWNNEGGILDIKEQIAARPKKTDFSAWQEAGKEQNALVNTILSADCHVIVTMRSKMEYNDVANGDWSSLASLARAQKYDYVFYGAVGKENSGLYLMYYLIRVDSGEIVWESTKSLK